MKRTFKDRVKHEKPQSDEESEEDDFIHFTKEEIEKQGRTYVKMPKKGAHRMHAHINPFNPLHIAHPINTTYVDWAEHYPHYYGQPNDSIVINTNKYPTKNAYVNQVVSKVDDRTPQILDIGCGYGGLMFQLTKGFPDKLILGMEIRDKVSNYVGEKINSIRCNSAGAICSNTAIIRSNAMKAFTNYFRKDSVSSTQCVTIWNVDREDVLLLCGPPL